MITTIAVKLWTTTFVSTLIMETLRKGLFLVMLVWATKAYRSRVAARYLHKSIFAAIWYRSIVLRSDSISREYPWTSVMCVCLLSLQLAAQPSTGPFYAQYEKHSVLVSCFWSSPLVYFHIILNEWLNRIIIGSSLTQVTKRLPFRLLCSSQGSFFWLCAFL